MQVFVLSDSLWKIILSKDKNLLFVFSASPNTKRLYELTPSQAVSMVTIEN